MSQAGPLNLSLQPGLVDTITATAPLTANGVSGTPESGNVTLALTTPLTGAYGGTGVANTGLTITLASGAVGKVLTSDSSGNGTWQVGGMQNYTLTPVNHATGSPYTVLATDVYLECDPTLGTITLDFPNSTTSGRGYVIKDATGQAAVHNITVTSVGGATLFDGGTSYVMNQAYQAITIVYSTTNGYEVI